MEHGKPQTKVGFEGETKPISDTFSAAALQVGFLFYSPSP
jgi:hypothetical protein